MFFVVFYMLKTIENCLWSFGIVLVFFKLSSSLTVEVIKMGKLINSNRMVRKCSIPSFFWNIPNNSMLCSIKFLKVSIV